MTSVIITNSEIPYVAFNILSLNYTDCPPSKKKTSLQAGLYEYVLHNHSYTSHFICNHAGSRRVNIVTNIATNIVRTDINNENIICVGMFIP